MTVHIQSRPIHSGQGGGEAEREYERDLLRWRVAPRARHYRPPTDVFETDETLVVRVEIAGMRESDFIISLSDRRLWIRGTRGDAGAPSDLPERRAYHQIEIPFGEFSTEVDLSCPVDAEAARASYQEGFLVVYLPKARPYHIRIGD